MSIVYLCNLCNIEVDQHNGLGMLKNTREIYVPVTPDKARRHFHFDCIRRFAQIWQDANSNGGVYEVSTE